MLQIHVGYLNEQEQRRITVEKDCVLMYECTIQVDDELKSVDIISGIVAQLAKQFITDEKEFDVVWDQRGKEMMKNFSQN